MDAMESFSDEAGDLMEEVYHKSAIPLDARKGKREVLQPQNLVKQREEKQQ